MQKCLQKKKASKRLFRTALALVTVWGTVLVIASGTADVPETSTFKAKYGKYLELGTDSFDTALKNGTSDNTEKNVEMNNRGDENSKTDNLTAYTNENAGKGAIGYAETVNVYMHESKKYKNMLLEDYVTGCVLAEMPSDFEAQALMAQAVAVRSFTCSKMNLSGLSSHPESPVCTDYRHCQSYISPEEYQKKGEYALEAVEKIREAVNATRGICAFYDGMPITAVYHASSGVRTKSSSEVWGGDVPYLTSVKAAENKNICSVEYTYSYSKAEELLSNENETVSCFSASGRDVECTADSEGIISAMSFSGKVFDSEELQKAFSLRSPDFSANLTNDGIVFTVYGYGHGVGMSQHGANALAKGGYGFMDILKYYYSGIYFSNIYS